MSDVLDSGSSEAIEYLDRCLSLLDREVAPLIQQAVLLLSDNEGADDETIEDLVCKISDDRTIRHQLDYVLNADIFELSKEEFKDWVQIELAHPYISEGVRANCFKVFVGMADELLFDYINTPHRRLEDTYTYSGKSPMYPYNGGWYL